MPSRTPVGQARKPDVLAGRAASSPPVQVWQALAAPPSRAEQMRRAVAGATDLVSATYDFTAQTTSDECAGTCHLDQLREWRDGEGSDMAAVPVWDAQDAAGSLNPDNTTAHGTMLGLAWQDWEFQHEYSEQSRFNQATCQRCHLPAVALSPVQSRGVYAPDTRGTAAANSDEGVTCVSCHLDASGRINGDIALPATSTQHQVVASTAFDGVSLCASCHNDPLFGALTRTVEEYQAQAPGSNPPTCVDCHMLRTDNSQLGHTFVGGHSPTIRGSALVATVPSAASTSSNYVISLQNLAAYHNAPTGDTFRAFSVHLTLKDASSKVLLDKEIFVTQPVITPTLSEVIKYEYISPIAFGDTGFISFGRLTAGSYKEHVDLQYYQTKPTILQTRLTNKWEEVTAFGKAVVKSWDQTLTVK